MINRWIGIAALGLMLSVNAALVVRDVLPGWLAAEPPGPRALQLGPGDVIDVQLGIFDGEARRIGYCWTTSGRTDDVITVKNRTMLQSLGLPGGVTTPPLRIETTLSYHGQTRLDELRIHVYGLGVPINLEGAFYEPDTFPCKWQVDTRRGSFVLPAAATRALGDVIRPFESLTGLQVGQSWRVELLNPLAGVVPGAGAGNMLSDNMLVEVTGLEQVRHRGTTVEAFVLEADNLRAWVTRGGRVIRQQVELPLFGTLNLVDEPYDEETRQRVLQGMLGR